MGLRSSRTQQLQQLAGQIPGQQQEQVKQAQAAQTQSVQQAFGYGARQPDQTPTGSQLQQMGTQMAQAAGQSQLQAQQQGMQTLAKQGEELLNERAQQKENVLQERQFKLSQREQEIQRQLYGISRKKGNELWAANLKFQKDELGRTLFNERQLTDWKISQAKTTEELAAFEQNVRLMSQKRMKMLEVAERKIQQELENQRELTETQRDGQFALELQKKLQNIKLKKAREAAEAANRAARSAAFGSIIGGALGLAGGVALAVATGGSTTALIPAMTATGASLGQGTATSTL